jgi:hypothetical protein
MRLSVIPSLKYSVFGSALTLTKGSTATESMASPRARKTANQVPSASSAASTRLAIPRPVLPRHHVLE